MLKSMTGFGRAVKVLANISITAEVKSLNSKYFDLNLRMPANYKEKELPLRKELSDMIELGKVDLTLNLERENIEGGFSINKILAKKYFEELSRLCDELKISKEDLLSKVMRMPDVISVGQDSAINEEEWKNIHQVILEAVRKMDDFRKAEGNNLEKELLGRIKKIETLLDSLKKTAPQRMTIIRNKILHSISEMVSKDKIDNNRLEQELVFYMEKLDITEEMVRLKSHCDYFRTIIAEKTISKGKKLAFISQELGREINTIGSKANDGGIQKMVVEMKDELEKIKEQLNNVL